MAFSFSSIKNLGCSPEPSEILFFFFAFFFFLSNVKLSHQDAVDFI